VICKELEKDITPSYNEYGESFSLKELEEQ